MSFGTATHIVIVSAVYPPEPVVSARMAHDLASYCFEQGMRVTVVAPQPSRPLSADYRSYQGPEAFVTTENGIEVVRLASYRSPESRLLPRFFESWSFGRHACHYLSQSVPNPDVIYLNTWPLLAQAQTAYYAQKKRIASVLQVMDVYPESLLAKIPAPLRIPATWPLLRLDAWTTRRVGLLVVISENMRRTYIQTRGIPERLVATVPTWQDDSLFEKVQSRDVACGRYQIPTDLFTFLYLGNIGPVAGVDFLIKAFDRASLKTAQLVIVGDGSAKADCVNLATRLQMTNIHFIADPDAANVPILQGMAHVCLLPMRNGTGMSSIPSKLPAYLFSSKPVIATVDPDSDTARLIREAECGWVGPPEDIEWLANKMREVASLKEAELFALGASGRVFGKDRFSKSHGVKRLANLLVATASK